VNNNSNKEIRITTDQQINIRFSYVCPAIDHEFCHNIVAGDVDPRGDSRVYPQTALAMLWRNVLSTTGQTWKTDFNLFFTITNCQTVRSRSLTHRINYKFMFLSAYWQWKLAHERTRISAVIASKDLNSPVLVTSLSRNATLLGDRVPLSRERSVAWQRQQI